MVSFLKDLEGYIVRCGPSFFCTYNKLFEKFCMNMANQECFSWVKIDSKDEWSVFLPASIIIVELDDEFHYFIELDDEFQLF